MPINATVVLCGARARRNNNEPCRQPGMLTNGRCRLHGGKSTGPRSEQGKAKSRQANLKHGRYTQEALREHMTVCAMMQWRKGLKENIEGNIM